MKSKRLVTYIVISAILVLLLSILFFNILNKKPKLDYYLDFQCPNCSIFAVQTLNPLLTQYYNKLDFEYRPIAFLDQYSNYKDSHNAAVAYLCAKNFGYEKEFAKLLEENYYADITLQKKQENIGYYSENKLIYFVEKLGKNTNDFESCYTTNYNDFYKLVDVDNLAAFNLGIKGTPTIFLNGKEINVQDLNVTLKDLFGN